LKYGSKTFAPTFIPFLSDVNTVSICWQTV